MLFLSSQQSRNGKQRTVSPSPSFWIAQALGALLFCPPDSIERWIPMMAPIPKSLSENQRRVIVDQILDDCWGESNSGNDPSGAKRGNSGYNIESMDEWIVDNQRNIRDETEWEANRQEDDVIIESQRESIIGSGENRDNDGTSASSKTSAVDSLFSNYFLSIHLLFSLPSFGDDDENDGLDFSNSPSNAISASTMKPSTYGEITTMGTRQLFGAMGLLDDNSNTTPNCHFLDLGSGAGKLVGQAVLELSDRTIHKATGIELSPSRHQAALGAKRSLLDWLKQANNNENSCDLPITANEIETRMELVEGDLFDVDLSTATHIYVASLCFPDALMLQLEEMLFQRITRQKSDNHNEKTSTLQCIATLRPFPNDLGGIRPIIRFMEMSWTSPLGSAVYMYRCDD